jgi:hypothetical protein
MPSRLADQTRNAMTNARTALFNGGKIRIYDGAQPATPATAASGTKLAEFTLDSTPAAASAAGSSSLNDLPMSQPALANGTAGWWRIIDSGGAAVEDGECGATGSGKEMILSNTALLTGVAVTIIGGTFAQPM